jgi:HlyD family secretion protein
MLSDSYKHLAANKPEGFSPFRPGMSASVDIQTEVKIDIPCIEIAAVTTRDDTTGRKLNSYERRKKEKKEKEKPEEEKEKEIKEYVFLYKEGVAVMREVKTGIQDNKFIEVKSGLSKGEMVITGPYSAVSKTLKNRDAVEKTSKDKLFENKDD